MHFSRNDVEFRVAPGLDPRKILRLIQMFLLIVGVSQENDEQAICWCGTPIPVPGLYPPAPTPAG